MAQQVPAGPKWGSLSNPYWPEVSLTTRHYVAPATGGTP